MSDIFRKGKEHDKRVQAKEKREGRNRHRAGQLIARRREILKAKEKLTNKEIEDVIKNESPGLWASYNLGHDLDEKEIEATSRVYNME